MGDVGEALARVGELDERFVEEEIRSLLSCRGEQPEDFRAGMKRSCGVVRVAEEPNSSLVALVGASRTGQQHRHLILGKRRGCDTGSIPGSEHRRTERADQFDRSVADSDLCRIAPERPADHLFECLIPVVRVIIQYRGIRRPGYIRGIGVNIGAEIKQFAPSPDPMPAYPTAMFHSFREVFSHIGGNPLRVCCRLLSIKPLCRPAIRFGRYLYYTEVIMPYLMQSDKKITTV